MAFKITFLGSGSAFTVNSDNYQSNVLLQKDNDTLLIDAGGDIRFSLNEQKLSYLDIKSLYISHLHADHVGGVEWLALNTFFDPQYKNKPNLFISEKILADLWERSLSGGLRTLYTENATLETFFNTHPIQDQGSFIWNDIHFDLIESIHVKSKCAVMPCYGLMMKYKENHIYFTADCQFFPKHFLALYEKATLIFHDCEILEKATGVHTHYKQLCTLDESVKKKMWLYHYNPGKLPDAVADGFLGFVEKGQSFIF